MEIYTFFLVKISKPALLCKQFPNLIKNCQINLSNIIYKKFLPVIFPTNHSTNQRRPKS